MILEIRLSNFFSIRDEIILDLRAGNIQTKQAKSLKENVFTWKKEQILKTLAIYGANASGKSNIIKAIRFCCRLIFESHLSNENTIFNFKPFKLDEHQNKDSHFFIRFISNNIEYEYSFSLNQKSITKESLFYYPNKRRAKIFTRDENKGESKREKYTFSNLIKRPFDVAENTSQKTLYISRASQMDKTIAKEIFTFFNEKFLLGYVDINVDLFKNNKEKILEILKIADSDIIDIQLQKKEIDSLNLKLSIDSKSEKASHVLEKSKNEILEIKTYHQSAPNIAFDLETEESEGTKKIFHIILRLIDIFENNKILLIDEIETHLHIDIINFIISMFHKSTSSQLIFSTHQTNLLDLKNLRKDQIYFVQKTNEGISDLYSLYDFKDFRENMDAEKGYLQGRFDAVPFIDYNLLEDNFKQNE